MKEIRHTGIVVKDIDKALHFYRDLLDFKVVKQMEESGDYIEAICGIKNIKVTTIKLAASDGSMIELLRFSASLPSDAEPKKINSPGITHISCTVKNIDALYDRLNKAKIQFNSSPKISPDGSAKVAFCRDPENNFIELVEVMENR